MVAHCAFGGMDRRALTHTPALTHCKADRVVTDGQTDRQHFMRSVGRD
jgi:hypothetical protein